MTDMKDRAREYLAEHSEYSEVFGQTFVAVDTLTAMVEFAEQETKDLKKNYKDSLIACGILKAKIDNLAQPSPLESMQDVLITTQKAVNEKQKEQLTKAKELIRKLIKAIHIWDCKNLEQVEAEAEQFLNSEVNNALS